jgi:carbon storage regulator CsrA
MLVLTRKPGEEVVVGDDVRVTVVAVQGHQVSLGFQAPREVAVYRRELAEVAGRVLNRGPGPRPGAAAAEALGRLGEGMVEVPLLLPGWQAAALEKAAGDQGLTVGELVRLLLRDLCHRSGKHILVVEDDASTRETLTILLEAQRYAVSRAANGQEALDLLRGTERPHLILLDLVMPVMSGWEFCSRRQHDPALASIPVVLFSGVQDVGQKAACLGAASYLQKPLEPEALVETIRRLAG